ncbi:MAG: N-acetylmuramoyl-L-alanine amidase family 2 [Parcubacteria group bacterium GW2011_GWC1_43_12]|nr:MAG: N-acetylmuramoyl-L-alanine amidase family 2 [Parcubacteria group bacterium GW2011_GWC1_43_12]
MFRKIIIFTSLLILACSVSAQDAGVAFYADSDLPMILPRSTWDNSPSLNALLQWLPDNNLSPSDWQPVERIVVHYTATPNNDPVSAIARIQSIYRFHAVTNGWGDIGYNYLIDQQGRIYEGRFGGNGVRAAHAYNSKQKNNYNYGTIGISFLGIYDAVDINPAMYESASRLVGWLSATNNLDPLDLNKKSLIWNSDQLAFVSNFSGPVVLGHADIDKVKTDPGIVSLNKIRQSAAVYKEKYKNYIYKSSDSPRVYKISSGNRQAFETVGDYAASGGSYSLLAPVSQNQLNLFSESRFLRYADGSLLRAAGQSSVYLVESGKLRTFNVSAKEFAQLGFNFDLVREVDPNELKKYSLGAEIKFASSSRLITDGNKVYLTEKGKKRWVTSGGLFKILGYKWSKVSKINSAEILSFLDGDPVLYPDKTLIREKNSPAVYLIKGGKKYEFVSAQSFEQMGYKWNKIIVGENNELLVYAYGGIAKHADGVLLRASDSPNVYLVKNGDLESIDGATFKKRKYSWSKVIVISPADFQKIYRPESISVASPSPTPIPSIAPSQSPAVSAIPSPTPVFSATPSPSPASQIGSLRVGLGQVQKSPIEFTAGTDFDVLDKKGNIVVSKKAGEKYSYAFSDPTQVFVKIKPKSEQGAVEIISYEDHPAWKPSLNYNQFRGGVEAIYSAKSGAVWLVNEIALEDYLKGISEVVEGDPLEHIKTMMVASRTYAYQYLIKGGKYGTDEVFHIKNTSADQLYKGYSREILAPTIAQSVNATKGEIILYQNEPIVSAYSSGASEILEKGTRAGCSVWSAKFCEPPYAYLSGGVKDPAGTQYTQPSCGGANHCVGLSAAGSRQMARSGKTYKEILTHYYLGIEVRKVY